MASLNLISSSLSLYFLAGMPTVTSRSSPSIETPSFVSLLFPSGMSLSIKYPL